MCERVESGWSLRSAAEAAGLSEAGIVPRVLEVVPLPVAPEVVWDAVATAEGIASWFVSCAMEPRVGGRIVQFADPGAPDPTTGPEAAAEAMLTATVGEITEYSPPTADAPGVFAYVERDWMGEGVPVPPWETSCEVVDDDEVVEYGE